MPEEVVRKTPISSLKIMSTLRATSSKPLLWPHQVRAIVWSTDDSRLVSCGMDGAVYEWNSLTSKRESENVLKSCSYTAVTISPDAKSIFAVGTDCTLKAIQDCQAGGAGPFHTPDDLSL